ncbi:MAG TPA: ABC transporter ATP-binding protein [Niabella sp.]|nr:ABC transporter ATP-binding protein [Chitinophagaceae bacterium]HRN48053.1 ABC transporter ATP-binding protein [Niabella sp.]HRO83293.1 ABC transporter ATP-binding protein [Niabella sp.]HUN03634.1 ABC transporter ATP-binding protein [Niabella sp.]
MNQITYFRYDMPLAVQIENLSFNYKNQPLLMKDLHLSIDEGLRYGIFGPNGAGKTTLMNLMAGLLSYKEGSIKIFGKEISAHKKEINRTIGYVPQDFAFYEELSPAENMEFFGAWYGMKNEKIKSKTKELLSVMGLSEVFNKPVKQFSGGMKRRVNLAIGMIHEPKILFLDEPTVGVDVQSRNAIITFLKETNRQGTTLIYTSHQLNEAEDLCQQIALIDQGEIIANNSLTELLQQHGQHGLEGLFLELTGRAYRD